MTVSRGTTRDHAETQGEQQWNHYHPKDGRRPRKREICGEETSFKRSNDLGWGRQLEQGWQGAVLWKIHCSYFSSSLQAPVESLQWPEPTGNQRARSLMDRVSGGHLLEHKPMERLEVNLEWKTADRDGNTSQMKQPLSLRMTKRSIVMMKIIIAMSMEFSVCITFQRTSRVFSCLILTTALHVWPHHRSGCWDKQKLTYQPKVTAS